MEGGTSAQAPGRPPFAASFRPKVSTRLERQWLRLQSAQRSLSIMRRGGNKRSTHHFRESSQDGPIPAYHSPQSLRMGYNDDHPVSSTVCSMVPVAR
jgi:hypothetical protein